MQNSEKLLYYLESFLGEGVPTSKDNYSFYCPFCNHRKRKLEVNIKSYKYNCWTCMNPPTKGSNFVFLLYKLGAEKDIIKRVKFNMSEDLLLKWESYSNSELPDKKIITKSIGLPKEYKSFDKGALDHIGKCAYKYLTENRKVPYSVIKSFKIGYCSTGKYMGRIIFPVFDGKGNVVYFVTRDILKYTNIPSIYPRDTYTGPLESNMYSLKTGLVPMEFFVNVNYPITLVEGMFDFYNTPNSIPLLGTTLHAGVLSYLIKNDNIKKVNIALDPEAFRKSMFYYKLLSSFNKEVKLIKLKEGEDPGSTGYHEMLLIIDNTDYFNDLELLKIKLNDI